MPRSRTTPTISYHGARLRRACAGAPSPRARCSARRRPIGLRPPSTRVARTTGSRPPTRAPVRASAVAWNARPTACSAAREHVEVVGVHGRGAHAERALPGVERGAAPPSSTSTRRVRVVHARQPLGARHADDARLGGEAALQLLVRRAEARLERGARRVRAAPSAAPRSISRRSDRYSRAGKPASIDAMLHRVAPRRRRSTTGKATVTATCATITAVQMPPNWSPPPPARRLPQARAIPRVTLSAGHARRRSPRRAR